MSMRFVRRTAECFLLATVALTAACNDLLNLERGHLRDEDEADGGTPGSLDGSLRDASPDMRGTSGDSSIGPDGAPASDAAVDQPALPDGQGGNGDVRPMPDANPGSDVKPGSDVVAPDASVPPDGSNPPPGQDGGATDAPVPPRDTGPTGCTAPQIDCNGKCVSPTDPKTCGSCTHDCTSLPHVSGAVTCQAGACVVPPSSCAVGWAHCSMNSDDGCEVDISKPEHCGTCTNMCGSTTPLCAQVSADAGSSGFQCKSQCSAPSPDLCGQSCVSKATDPLNCGTCGNACPAPTAHGKGSCSNGMCGGFSCDPGYPDTCNGTCVNTSNDTSNCGSCGNLCKPPTNGSVTGCASGQCQTACNGNYPDLCTATNTCVNKSTDTSNCGSCGNVCQPPANGSVTGCAGGQCQTACNDGYDKVGMNCTQVRFYIAENGNDSAAGTETAPFKTWNRAATRASLVPGCKIYFKTGVYPSNAAGEDFTVKIPDGATIGTVGGKVLLQGNAVAGLPFAGSGTINGGSTVDGLTLQGFSEPLSTSTGTQTITNVTLTDIQTPIFVTGDANMTFDGFAMSSTEISGQFRVWSGNLTLTNGTLKSNVSSCVSASPTANALDGTGTLTLNQVDADGTIAINGGSATVTGSTLRSYCAGQNRALRAGAVSVTLTNNHFTYYSDFDTTTLKVRGNTFDGFVVVRDPGSYDFGKSGSNGNNIFNVGIQVLGQNVSVNATGNRWQPNDTGISDGNGNVSSRVLQGPQNTLNFYIAEQTSSITF